MTAPVIRRARPRTSTCGTRKLPARAPQQIDLRVSGARPREGPPPTVAQLHTLPLAGCLPYLGRSPQVMRRLEI